MAEGIAAASGGMLLLKVIGPAGRQSRMRVAGDLRVAELARAVAGRFGLPADSHFLRVGKHRLHGGQSLREVGLSQSDTLYLEPLAHAQSL